MSTQPYLPPVSLLLTYGAYDVADTLLWPDYLALGFTAEHIPELIRMATDRTLQRGTDFDDPRFFASLHAMRTLGQLRAEEAIEPLLAVLEMDYEECLLMGDLPHVYGMIGPAAISTLTAFLRDTSLDIYDRAYMADGLVEIARQHPEARAEVVSILMEQLTRFEQEDATFNSFIVAHLAELKEIAAFSLILRAFEADKVNTDNADLDYVLYYLGLKQPEVPLIELDPNAAETPWLNGYHDGPFTESSN
ncbi:MAG TPA: hypothetical protein VKV40_13525 [Ktedonobacteraceae bacterium]|nr:hypothetical protein [Ktedonobacteraceae bacterium]